MGIFVEDPAQFVEGLDIESTATFVTQVVADLAFTRGVSNITIEGAPSYLWPNYPTQEWDHLAYSNSWPILSGIQDGLDAQGIFAQHWFLYDDIHNVPEGTGPDAIGITREQLMAQNLGEVHYVAAESALQLADGDTCEIMDARFQTEKLKAGLSPEVLEAVRDRSVLIDTIPLPVNIMIHPMSFETQQRGMLQRMVGQMGQDEMLAQIPRKGGRRSALLEQTYIHVWLDDETGEVASITRPVFREGQVIFESLI